MNWIGGNLSRLSKGTNDGLSRRQKAYFVASRTSIEDDADIFPGNRTTLSPHASIQRSNPTPLMPLRDNELTKHDPHYHATKHGSPHFMSDGRVMSTSVKRRAVTRNSQDRAQNMIHSSNESAITSGRDRLLRSHDWLGLRLKPPLQPVSSGVKIKERFGRRRRPLSQPRKSVVSIRDPVIPIRHPSLSWLDLPKIGGAMTGANAETIMIRIGSHDLVSERPSADISGCHKKRKLSPAGVLVASNTIVENHDIRPYRPCHTSNLENCLDHERNPQSGLTLGHQVALIREQGPMKVISSHAEFPLRAPSGEINVMTSLPDVPCSSLLRGIQCQGSDSHEPDHDNDAANLSDFASHAGLRKGIAPCVSPRSSMLSTCSCDTECEYSLMNAGETMRGDNLADPPLLNPSPANWGVFDIQPQRNHISRTRLTRDHVTSSLPKVHPQPDYRLDPTAIGKTPNFSSVEGCSFTAEPDKIDNQIGEDHDDTKPCREGRTLPPEKQTNSSWVAFIFGHDCLGQSFENETV